MQWVTMNIREFMMYRCLLTGVVLAPGTHYVYLPIAQTPANHQQLTWSWISFEILLLMMLRITLQAQCIRVASVNKGRFTKLHLFNQKHGNKALAAHQQTGHLSLFYIKAAGLTCFFYSQSPLVSTGDQWKRTSAIFSLFFFLSMDFH